MELIERDETTGIGVWMMDEIDVRVGIYAVTQTTDGFKDRDVFVVPTEGIIGFLCGAWPVATIYPKGENDDLHGLHTADPDADLRHMGKRDRKVLRLTVHPTDGEPYETEYVLEADPGTDYVPSIRKCVSIAGSDADITGNDHWAEQANDVQIDLHCRGLI